MEDCEYLELLISMIGWSAVHYAKGLCLVVSGGGCYSGQQGSNPKEWFISSSTCSTSVDVEAIARMTGEVIDEEEAEPLMEHSVKSPAKKLHQLVGARKALVRPSK